MWELILKTDFEFVNEPDSIFLGMHNHNTKETIINLGKITAIFNEEKPENWKEDDKTIDEYIEYLQYIMIHESTHEAIGNISDEISEELNISKKSLKIIMYNLFWNEIFVYILQGESWKRTINMAKHTLESELDELAENIPQFWTPRRVANRKKVVKELAEQMENWHKKYQIDLAKKLKEKINSEE